MREQEIKRYSFDPWGQRRQNDWDSLTASSLYAFEHALTTRGFTGHEMLDEVGLIHMNGRIYDARVGRFMQADPIIDGSTFTQGYNRYSYLHNNPLNATDPSGYTGITKVLDIVVAVVAVVASIFAGPDVGIAIWEFWTAMRPFIEILDVLYSAYSAVSAIQDGNMFMAMFYAYSANDMFVNGIPIDASADALMDGVKTASETASECTGFKFLNAAFSNAFDAAVDSGGDVAGDMTRTRLIKENGF